MEQKRRELEMIYDELDKNEELMEWSPMETEVYARMDEAYALINNKDATPKDVKKGEQMFEEINKRKPEIDAYQKEKRERYENNRRILMKKMRQVRRELRQLQEEDKRILESEIEMEFLTKPLRF